MPYLAHFLAPDRSATEWLRRHATYWLGLLGTQATVWAYWTHSWLKAFSCVLLLLPLLYVPTTYLLLYWALPQLLAGQLPAFGRRLLAWLAVFLALRFGLLQLGFYPPLWVGLGLTAYPWQSLFDATFMVTTNLVVVAVALKLFRHHYQKEQANRQLTQQTLAIELKTLRAQLQPHFLFNTLNSIYALTLRQSPQAGPAVRQLAALLRQMFHADAAAEVSLHQEIALLQNYIELEQLRYGQRLSVTLRISGVVANQWLAPLVLLPFVENAFKHGVATLTGPARISADLLIRPDALHFSLHNTCAAHAAASPQPGGLGLQNVRKRLTLLYPGQHRLRVHAEATRYAVELTIPLHSGPPASPAAAATPLFLATPA